MTKPDTIFNEAEQGLIRQALAQPADRAAQMLIKLAGAYWRQGEKRKFAEAFRRGFLERPYGDLTQLLPAPGRMTPAELRDIARTLAEHGVLYSPVLGSLAMAEAKLGHAEETRRLVDYSRFFHHATCPPPDGMSSDAFHDAVAAEIKSDLKFYDDPSSRAIRHGWRHDTVLRVDTPMLTRLRQMLQKEVDRYVAALPDDPSHPFLAAQPKRKRMGGWAVVSTADSHHISHIHPAAWVTGVYYISQPPV